MEEDRKFEVWLDRTPASLCKGLSEVIHLFWIVWMNRYAVLSDGISDKDDNAAISVSQAVSMETSRAKQKLPII